MSSTIRTDIIKQQQISHRSPKYIDPKLNLIHFMVDKIIQDHNQGNLIMWSFHLPFQVLFSLMKYFSIFIERFGNDNEHGDGKYDQEKSVQYSGDRLPICLVYSQVSSYFVCFCSAQNECAQIAGEIQFCLACSTLRFVAVVQWNQRPTDNGRDFVGILGWWGNFRFCSSACFTDYCSNPVENDYFRPFRHGFVGRMEVNAQYRYCNNQRHR